MKKILFLAAFSFAVFTTQSCKSGGYKKENDEINVTDVPGSVQTTFNEKYSGATNVKWENAHENNEKTYKAKFTWNGKDMEAEFDASGTFIKGHEE